MAVKSHSRLSNRQITKHGHYFVGGYDSYILIESEETGNGILRIADTDYTNYAYVVYCRHKYPEGKYSTNTRLKNVIINRYLHCSSFKHGLHPIFYNEPYGRGQGECSDGTLARP